MPWAAQRPSRSPGGFTRIVGEAAQSLFATLFPSDCRLCRLPLVNISRLPVCDACLDAMQPVRGLACCRCGERLLRPQQEAQPDDDFLCPQCRRAQPPFERALAYGSYEGGLRELIHLLKYEQVKPAAQVLGRMLAEVLQALHVEAAEAASLVVPVPLHGDKLRQRGFNQAEHIARAAVKIAAQRGRALQLQADLLRRRRATRSQTGLTRHQRRENVRGAFVVERPELVKERAVILVDDVFTTGTTVSECARVLMRGGAARVYVATVARVLRAEAAGAMLPPDAQAESQGEPAGERAAAAHV